MGNYDALAKNIAEKLQKALDHLAYSFQKVQKLP